MGVVDEAGRHAMEASGNTRNKGTENVPTSVLDPTGAGGVMAAPEDGKRRLQRNASTVAKRATEKVSC